MKLRNLAAATVIGGTMIASAPAFARHHDYDHDRCADCGTVVSVRHVRHEDKHFGAGTAIGAVAGGVLGHQVGKGDGRTAATVAGAVAGGAVGHEVEKNNRDDRSGWRVVVNMDRGRDVTVVMRHHPDVRDGDRVRVHDGYVERY